MPTRPYCAVIATFKRAEVLSELLTGLLAQEAALALLVVADNDPASSARAVVEGHGASAPTTAVVYLPMAANLGPAGGWARAVAHAAPRPDRGDWVMVFDDDDPVADPRVTSQLLAEADKAPADVAAVGLRGARWHRPTATLHRVHGAMDAPAKCDYLGSGGVPLYRWSAIDAHGFFDEELFFGFEDLDLGLRLRARGLGLRVVAIEAQHVIHDTAPTRVPWREYFKTRALITVCRRHLGWWATTVTMVRAVLLGGPWLAIKHRRPDLMVARWRGFVDAVRGRLGSNEYVPTNNPAKPR
jgi:GT2 family glycosyltransferase